MREPVPLDETAIEQTSDTPPPPLAAPMREPTERFIHDVTLAIRNGASPSVASEWCGISRSVFKRWLKKHDGLRTAVRQATAHLKVRLQTDLAKRSPEKALRRLGAREEQADEGRRYSQEARPYTLSGATIVAKAAPFLVERVNDDSVPTDALSPVEQAARALRHEMLADLGGTQHVSAAKRALLDSIMGSWIIAQSLDACLFRMAADDGLVSRKHRRAFPLVEQRMRVIDSLGRQLESLGLDRAKSTPTDLNAYIESRYGGTDNAQGEEQP